MKIAILGYGAEGQAAVAYWSQPGNELTVCDANEHVELPSGLARQLGPDYLSNLDTFDLIVRSPGLPPQEIIKANPQSPKIAQKVTSGMNEFYRVCPTPNIIGVTGTKGKGTTSSLIAELLRAAGKTVHLGGNIGVPALELLSNDIKSTDWVVLEESSFQLSDQKYSPPIAVCLMMAPEHLNWHGKLEDYHQAKQNLFAHQRPEDLVIFNRLNDTSMQIASASKAKNRLSYEVPDSHRPSASTGAYVSGETIYMNDVAVCKTSDAGLLGRHNLQNICAAIAATWDIIHGDTVLIQQTVRNFKGLDHRLELVRTLDEVRYYNDSFASAPDAAMAAITAVPGKKIIILGGFDRQLPLESLAQTLAKHQQDIRRLLLIGASADRLAKALKTEGFDNFEMLKHRKMQQIVARARELAQPHDAVVLSPGFPSFDMFKNFEDRGQQYQAAVRYQTFVFESYDFNPQSKQLTLTYNFDDAITFREVYRFSFPLASYDPAALDRACQLLFFMAGISYYKAYVPSKIVVRAGQIDQATADFLSKTYQRGLGEFWFVNQLDPNTPVNFPVTTPKLEAIDQSSLEGLLVGIGGGKDSLVTVEALRDQPTVSTWSLNHQSQLKPLVSKIGLLHSWVERQIDQQLLDLNDTGAYNGHVPISAIFACVGAVAAILSGRRDHVVSNESSANEATLQYNGVEINHQYSKSSEFETDFQQLLQHHFGHSLRYYSFLRPLSEIYIAELFAEKYFETYQHVFSSCNRAFTLESNQLSWCGNCPKCAFIFLALTPFIDQRRIEALFGGRNLLLDPKKAPLYRQILGIEGDKPLDCVGAIKESRAAMRLAQEIYPQLCEFEFELPKTYDYHELTAHTMPPHIHQALKKLLSSRA